MKVPALPANESERLDCLYHLNILDTPQDERFDRLTRMASQLLGCPTAVVSLVDRERQWFKSKVGLAAQETSRDISFCGHAVEAASYLEVPNARVDPRFSDNPLVIGEPGIVFYAGAPICTGDGLVLGTLCVIDYTPRQFSDAQKMLLHDLAEFAADQIRLHRLQQDSAELVKQSVELRRSEQQLRTVIEGTRIGTWEWNIQTGETRFNERWAEMIGYTLAELEPISIKTWAQLAHPEDLERSNVLLQKHFVGELDFYDCKCRIRHKKGHWVWVHDRGQIVAWDQQNYPLVMCGTHADITEHMALRHTLEAQHTQLHNMLSNLPGIVYRCANDANWTMQFVSDDVQRLTGYPAVDFIPRKGGTLTFRQIMHPEDAARIGVLAPGKLGGNRFRLEYRIRHADGRYRWVEEVGQGENDEHGQIAYLDGFIWDITERKEALASLEAERSKFSSLFSLAPVGIASITPAGELVEANPEFRSLLGFPADKPADLVGLSCLPELLSAIADEKPLTANPRFKPCEKRVVTNEGKELDVMVSAVRINDTAGADKVWLILQDITGQKQLDRMKNELIAVVSHELRTPLTSIIGALGLTRRRLGEDNSQLRQLIEIAYSNGMRLNMLVNDLLDMEKLLAGKMTFKMQVLDLGDLLSQAQAENQAYADQFNVTLCFSLPRTTVGVTLDRLRFQQVMSNLLSNAVKFSHAGGAVQVDVALENDVVRIFVRDQGCGIPEEKQHRIFEKFGQIDSPNTRKTEGTGLGLAITRELVERMNGSIGFTSRLGVGTTFFIVLPVAASADS